MKDIKVLQNKILEIAVYFDGVLRQNDIVYYLMGGALLALSRHQALYLGTMTLMFLWPMKITKNFIKFAREKLDTKGFIYKKKTLKNAVVFYQIENEQYSFFRARHQR